MTVAARFFVKSFEKQTGGTAIVKLAAATSKENAEWTSYTPNGNIEMFLTRKAGGARKFFEDNIGKDIAITFDVAEGDRTELSELSKIWQANEAVDAEELGDQPAG